MKKYWVKILKGYIKKWWVLNYFIIYDDQNFYYDRANSGNVTPEDIKNKISQNPKGKNNCSKEHSLDFDNKLDELLKIESEIITKSDTNFGFHSGPILKD